MELWTSRKNPDFMGFSQDDPTGKPSGDFRGFPKGKLFFHYPVENPPVEGEHFVDEIGEKSFPGKSPKWHCWNCGVLKIIF